MKKVCIILLILLFAFPLIANRKAPGFALWSNKGKMVFKSRLKGNLLISFWSSTCLPCKKEMPYLIKLEKKYKSLKNLRLVLINTDINDNSGSAKTKARKTMRELGLNHGFLLDIYQMALAKYNPKKTVPSLFLVNKYGRIIFQEIGAHKNTLVKLENAIRRLRK